MNGRRRIPAVAVAVLLMVGVGGFAGHALSATPPDPVADLALAARQVIPGPAPALPWPAGADAALDVPGLGSLPGSRGSEAVPIGSVAKIMTALLVLRAHPLVGAGSGPTLSVTASDVADYQARRASGQSLLPVYAGERLTEYQALQALLIPSANNIAVLLARWTSSSVPAFVVAMNDAARRLHLVATRYTDPSGYDAGTVSSAKDQVRLAEAVLAVPGFEAVTAQRAVTLPGAGLVRNYNTLLGGLGVSGVKTGSTDAAGGNVVFAAHRVIAGRQVTFVGALLGQHVGEPAQVALTAALRAAAAVLTVAETTVRPRIVLAAQTPVATLRPEWGRPVRILTARAAVMLGWPGLAIHLDVSSVPVPPGPAGSRAGRLQVTVLAARPPESTLVVSLVPLVTAARVTAPSPLWYLQRSL